MSARAVPTKQWSRRGDTYVPLVCLSSPRGSSLAFGREAMHPVMNDTKWEELRLAMDSLGTSYPKWRVRTMGSGHISEWDGDWFYHFKCGGYDDIEWVEIRTTSESQRSRVLGELRRIHVPGQETEDGFKVYGYVASNQSIEYI